MFKHVLWRTRTGWRHKDSNGIYLRYTRQGVTCPRIQCNACKEIVEEIEAPNVAWKEPGDNPQIYILCKACDVGSVNRMECWIPFNNYLVYLLADLKLTGQCRAMRRHMLNYRGLTNALSAKSRSQSRTSPDFRTHLRPGPENTGQRDDSSSAIVGSIASAIRFLVMDIFTGGEYMARVS